MKNIYESTYKNRNHFSFGKNWQKFLKTLNEEKIEEAKKSLTEFLGGEKNIKEKTFVDIGCGSGLFSLAAYLLGASKIVSSDIDDFSIACVKHLKEKQGNPENWQTIKGSALDENFISSLGQFDIVYSWGVLHHTGNMYKAFDNICPLVSNDGCLFLAIYNDSKNRWREGTSKFWQKAKKFYNSHGLLTKKIMTWLYVAYFFIGLLIMGKNPIQYIKNYKSNRGMNWYNDIMDWLGGYPYEFASPDEIINYFSNKNMLCKKLIYREGIGCSEYLLIKNE